MDLQRTTTRRTRNEGGLLSLAALLAVLLIGGLEAAIPKSAEPQRPGAASRRPDPDDTSHGPGSRARHPAPLPSADSAAARPCLAGGRE
jgi:hypothetical protein